MLLWILARCNNEVDAVESPIGYLPKPEDIDLEGTDIDLDTLKGLLSIDRDAWAEEVKDQEAHLAKFEKLPAEIKNQYENLKKRLGV